jgi:hypothetical protein
MVDFPAPLGPSTLTNKPRSWLEKGRSIPALSQFVAAELTERQRSGAAMCGEVHEQARGDHRVVYGTSVLREFPISHSREPSARNQVAH